MNPGIADTCKREARTLKAVDLVCRTTGDARKRRGWWGICEPPAGMRGPAGYPQGTRLAFGAWMWVFILFVNAWVFLLPQVAAALPIVTVSLVPEKERLVVAYRFSTPVTRLDLRPQNSEERLNHWEVIPPVLLEGNSIRRHDGKAFDRLVVTVQPDKYEFGGYPEFLHARSTWIINLAYLLPAKKSVSAIRLRLPDKIPVIIDGGCRNLHGIVPIDRIGHSHFLLMSKDKDVITGQGGTCAAFLGKRLEPFIRTILKDTSQFLDRLLYQRNSQFLVIVDERTSAAHFFQRGSVDAHETVLLQLYGQRWLRMSEAQIRRYLDPFLSHELAHVWEDGASISLTDSAHPWFWEGAAEFAALQYLEEKGRDDLALWQRHVTACRMVVGRRFSDSDFGRSRAEAYGCGTLFFLASDWLLRKRGAYPEGFFAFYRAMIASKTSGQTPTIHMLLDSLLGTDPIYRKLVRGEMEQNWNFFLSAFAAKGIAARETPMQDQALVTESWLAPMMRSLCTGPSGYWQDARWYVLDAPRSRCKLSGARRRIDSVNGVNFLRNPVPARQIVVRACRQERSILLSGPGKLPPLTVPCHFVVRPVPSDLQLFRQR